MNTKIKEAVNAAGGSKQVALALGISYQAITKWGRSIPRTEWTGETDYLSQIESLQKKRHGKVLVSAEQIKAAQVWD